MSNSCFKFIFIEKFNFFWVNLVNKIYVFLCVLYIFSSKMFFCYLCDFFKCKFFRWKKFKNCIGNIFFCYIRGGIKLF